MYFMRKSKRERPCRANLLSSLLRCLGGVDLVLPELADEPLHRADEHRAKEQSTNHRNGGDEVHLHVVANGEVTHLRVPESCGLFHFDLLCKRIFLIKIHVKTTT